MCAGERSVRKNGEGCEREREVCRRRGSGVKDVEDEEREMETDRVRGERNEQERSHEGKKEEWGSRGRQRGCATEQGAAIRHKELKKRQGKRERTREEERRSEDERFDTEGWRSGESVIAEKNAGERSQEDHARIRTGCLSISLYLFACINISPLTAYFAFRTFWFILSTERLLLRGFASDFRSAFVSSFFSSFFGSFIFF